MKGPGTIVNKVKAMAIWRKDGQETDVAHNRQKKEEERCLVVPPYIICFGSKIDDRKSYSPGRASEQIFPLPSQKNNLVFKHFINNYFGRGNFYAHNDIFFF